MTTTSLFSAKYHFASFGTTFVLLFTFCQAMPQPNSIKVVSDKSLFSAHLNRNVTLDVVLPPNYTTSKQHYKVLLMNDGQDIEQLKMVSVLEKTYKARQIQPIILVAIRCGDRMQEYGTATQADYKGRGSKAGQYTQFVIEELLPHIANNYRTLSGSENTAFCGFSLGGLSAFDIVWHNPAHFGKVGAFSASFWWRQKAYENQYSDELDRIMHNLVRNVDDNNNLRKNLKFWIQTGTQDEKDDRNKNGIIDSIDDATDLITELEKKGFQRQRDIRYVEVVGGQHNQQTWSAIMPDFLEWAFGRQ
jgi:enterochelin esterase-like enzyme